MTKVLLCMLIVTACGGDDDGAGKPPRAAAGAARAGDAAVVATDASTPQPVVAFVRVELESSQHGAALTALGELLGEGPDFAGAIAAPAGALIVRISAQPERSDTVLAAVRDWASGRGPTTMWWATGRSAPATADAELLLRVPAIDPERFAGSFSLPGTSALAFVGKDDTALATIAGDNAESLEKLSQSPELKKALVRAGATGPPQVWIASRFDAKL